MMSSWWIRSFAFLAFLILPMQGVAEMGYIYEIDEFENEMRDDEDLPPAPEPDVDAIEKIMRITGFLDKVEASKR